MRRAYLQIAWGLALELIDFRIGMLDILPDFVGYFLLALGLSRLNAHNRGFNIAWFAAGVQFVFSIMQMFGAPTGFSLTGVESVSTVTLVLMTFSVAFEMLLYYGLCRGIRESAEERDKIRLADSARTVWSVAFCVGFLNLFLFPFQLNYTLQSLFEVVLLLAFASLAVGLWVLLLARRAGRELSEPGGGDNGEDAAGKQLDVRI